MTARDRIAALVDEAEQAIRAASYELTYRPYVEDHLTPGFPGLILGRTDRDGREVVVSTVAVQSDIARLRVLRHELRHVLDPEWVCGSRARMAELFPGLYSPNPLRKDVLGPIVVGSASPAPPTGATT